MGVKKYRSPDGLVLWMVDTRLQQPDGRLRRVRKMSIPTREQAMALLAKWKAEAFEGRFFDRPKTTRLTVQQVWDAYAPISKRDKDSWRSDIARARYVGAHQEPRNSGRLADGVRIGRELADAAVHG